MKIYHVLLVLILIGTASAGIGNRQTITLDGCNDIDFKEELQTVLDSECYNREYRADPDPNAFDCMDITLLCQDFLIRHGYSTKIMLCAKLYPESSHCYCVVDSGNGWIPIESCNLYLINTTMGYIVSIGQDDKINYGTGILLNGSEDLYAVDDFRDE
jgi:hypothetical protein